MKKKTNENYYYRYQVGNCRLGDQSTSEIKSKQKYGHSSS